MGFCLWSFSPQGSVLWVWPLSVMFAEWCGLLFGQNASQIVLTLNYKPCMDTAAWMKKLQLLWGDNNAMRNKAKNLQNTSWSTTTADVCLWQLGNILKDWFWQDYFWGHCQKYKCVQETAILFKSLLCHGVGKHGHLANFSKTSFGVLWGPIHTGHHARSEAK